MNRETIERKKIKNQSGVTLIALVLTLVIMLLLIGVSLTYTNMDGGLFARTNHAGHEYNVSTQKEATRFNALNEYVEQYYHD